MNSKDQPTDSLKQNRHSGQSLTELALILPLLILVLMGTIDFARLYFAYVTITNSAREGAREGALNHNDVGNRIETRAIQEATNSGVTLQSSNISQSCYETSVSYSNPSSMTCASATVSDTIRVKVTYTFSFTTSYVLGLGSYTLSNYADMEIQSP